MTRSMTYTLLPEGSSDATLITIINWTIAQCKPHLSFTPQLAKNLGKVGTSLRDKIPAALRAFPCDLLFVHRDADSQGHDVRLAEIRSALDHAHTNWVPIIPIKMTEAWLLSNEVAIREAAGNRNGTLQLTLPPKKKWEDISDPKQALFDALTKASEKSGRALQKFRPEERRPRVAELTQDFSTLRGLKSFDHFESALRAQLQDIT